MVVISGATGLVRYRHFGQQLAELGYYAVLIDGKKILTRDEDGTSNLRTVIAEAQASPQGLPGKVMVIGFSQGGGGVLAHAAAMPELVNAAVAYYPSTRWARDLSAVVERIQIPVLVLAGARDRYNNCCLVESMREMEALAKARQIPLELVVYPDAGHAFNLSTANYRAEETADAWRRVVAMLARYQPLAR